MVTVEDMVQFYLDNLRKNIQNAGKDVELAQNRLAELQAHLDECLKVASPSKTAKKLPVADIFEGEIKGND